MRRWWFSFPMMVGYIAVYVDVMAIMVGISLKQMGIA